MSARSTVSEILALARDPAESDLDELGSRLDRAEHALRLEVVRRLGGETQAALHEAAADRPARVAQLVPPEQGPLEPVVHDGENSLPVFSAFQKRFCRSPEGSPSAAWGYNEQSLRWLTGPGYFVVREHDEGARIDYRRTPDDRPEGWPPVVSNDRRLGRFVYAGTVDRMRRLSEHVTVGRAWEDDTEPMDNWFVLVRRDSDRDDRDRGGG